MIRLDSIEYAVEQFAAGKPVVVIDDEDRENEGDLIFSAELATPELVAFAVRYSSGYLCVALTAQRCEELQLPLMSYQNDESFRTAFTITVDAKEGVTTGISAKDRAHTMNVLAHPNTVPKDLTRPGHIAPLQAKEGGVLRRPGHTEAAIDLAKIAGLQPAGALVEIVSQKDDFDMARTEELRVFADEHKLAMISIADLISWRSRNEKLVERAAKIKLPTNLGDFQAFGYRSLVDNTEHFALVKGDIGSGEDILVRVHSECLTGDIFGSLRCDCGFQLRTALEKIEEEGRGILLYMRGHEGRGIGLLSKLQAYELQEQGIDTVDANLQLGFPVDLRDYGIGAQILVDLGVKSMRLISNNPVKRAALDGYGLKIVERIALNGGVHKENIQYLLTKRDKMGHDLSLDSYTDFL